MQIERRTRLESESAILPSAPLARSSAKAESGSRRVNSEHGVWVLADDPAAIKAVRKHLEKAGYRTSAVVTTDELLKNAPPAATTCLVVIQPPARGAETPQIIEQLKQQGHCLPVVVIAFDWELRHVVKTLKAGAIQFLAAPADPEELLDAVEEALQQAQATQRQQHFIDDAVQRVASLNPREKQILALILAGLLNKEIADRLNLALVTVKVYRAQVMKKLGAGNAASMACIAGLGGMDVQAGLTFIDG